MNTHLEILILFSFTCVYIGYLANLSNKKIEQPQHNVTKLNLTNLGPNKFHLVKGSLNLTIDAMHNSTSHRLQFCWSHSNKNCVCLNTSADNRIWHDEFMTNCTCITNLFDDECASLIDEPKLLCNSHTLLRGQQSVLGNYIIYPHDDQHLSSSPRYNIELLITNKNFTAHFREKNVSVWQIVNYIFPQYLDYFYETYISKY